MDSGGSAVSGTDIVGDRRVELTGNSDGCCRNLRTGISDSVVPAGKISGKPGSVNFG